jgi:flagellar protein FliO/FliZ
VDVHYVRFVLALLFVLGLIGLLAFALRRFGLGAVRVSPAFRGKARNAERRLAVVEVATVDARHRLVLIRRDGVEHLVLLGHGGDLLVETNIVPPETPPAGAAQSFRETLRSTGSSQA